MTTLLDLTKICEAAKPDELRNREDIIKLFCVNGCDTEEAEFIATFHPIRTAEMIELLMEGRRIFTTEIGADTPKFIHAWLARLAAFEGAE